MSWTRVLPLILLLAACGEEPPRQRVAADAELVVDSTACLVYRVHVDGHERLISVPRYSDSHCPSYP